MNRIYSFKCRAKRLAMRGLDALGDTAASLFRCQHPASHPRRLLILRLDHLGDVICMLPLLERLTARADKPYLAVCVSPAGATLLRDTPGIDEIIPFDAPWFRRERPSGTPTGILSLIQRWHQGHFDTVWELRGDLRHHLLTLLAKIPIRAGYGNTGGGFLLNHELLWDPRSHAIDSNLRFLSILGDHTNTQSPARLVWKPRLDEVHWAQQTLPRDPYIVVHADAGTPAKRWPSPRFAALIGEITLPVILVGSDPHIGESVMKEVRASMPILDLTGKTSLPQLVTLLQRAERVISCDSGPAQIAAALGTPTRILWSGTNAPETWAPRGSHVRWVRHEVDCSPCGQSRCPLPRHLCMEDLTVEDVREALA